MLACLLLLLLLLLMLLSLMAGQVPDTVSCVCPRTSKYFLVPIQDVPLPGRVASPYDPTVHVSVDNPYVLRRRDEAEKHTVELVCPETKKTFHFPIINIPAVCSLTFSRCVLYRDVQILPSAWSSVPLVRVPPLLLRLLVQLQRQQQQEGCSRG